MTHLSKPSIDIKALGTSQGADKMMKIEAIGNLVLKIGAAIGSVLVGAAAFIAALSKAGLI